MPASHAVLRTLSGDRAQVADGNESKLSWLVSVVMMISSEAELPRGRSITARAAVNWGSGIVE